MRKTIIAIAIATLIAPATANADNIDFGTNEAGCRAAEQQLHSSGNTSADCFQTGPGHYSLTYSQRQQAPSYNHAPIYLPQPVYVPPAPSIAANVGPALGSDCVHADLNRVTIASDGSSMRCSIASSGEYRWMIDTGVAQVDPAIAGHAAWDTCMSNPANTAADCRCQVDGNCS